MKCFTTADSQPVPVPLNDVLLSLFQGSEHVPAGHALPCHHVPRGTVINEGPLRAAVPRREEPCVRLGTLQPRLADRQHGLWQ